MMGAEMRRCEKGNIGQNIKRFRKERNLSQSELAKHLWLDRTSLSGYEIGKRTPDIYMLWRLADFFGVSLDILVGRECLHEDM